MLAAKSSWFLLPTPQVSLAGSCSAQVDGSSLTSPAISWKLQLRLGTSFPRAMFIFSETNSHPTSPPQPMACQPVMASRQQNPGHKTNGSHFYPRLLSIARNWLRIGPCCRSSAAPGGLFCKRHETPPSCHSLGPSIETTAFYGQHTMQFLPMFQVDSKVQTHTIQHPPGQFSHNPVMIINDHL